MGKKGVYMSFIERKNEFKFEFKTRKNLQKDTYHGYSMGKSQ